MRKVGCFSRAIIEKLNLNIEEKTPIYIGTSNIEHIESRHPYEYDKYFRKLESIIQIQII